MWEHVHYTHATPLPSTEQLRWRQSFLDPCYEREIGPTLSSQPRNPLLSLGVALLQSYLNNQSESAGGEGDEFWWISPSSPVLQFLMGSIASFHFYCFIFKLPLFLIKHQSNWAFYRYDYRPYCSSIVKTLLNLDFFKGAWGRFRSLVFLVLGRRTDRIEVLLEIIAHCACKLILHWFWRVSSQVAYYLLLRCLGMLRIFRMN